MRLFGLHAKANKTSFKTLLNLHFTFRLSSCKSFNNLNSFLAITIGLMNGAVSRLRETWKEVPIRTKNRLEQFQALTVRHNQVHCEIPEVVILCVFWESCILGVMKVVPNLRGFASNFRTHPETTVCYGPWRTSWPLPLSPSCPWSPKMRTSCTSGMKRLWESWLTLKRCVWWPPA